MAATETALARELEHSIAAAEVSVPLSPSLLPSLPPSLPLAPPPSLPIAPPLYEVAAAATTSVDVVTVKQQQGVVLPGRPLSLTRLDCCAVL